MDMLLLQLLDIPITDCLLHCNGARGCLGLLRVFRIAYPNCLSAICNLREVCLLLGFFGYLGIAGSILPGKLVPGANLADGTRLHYRCNGLLSLLLLVGLLVIDSWMEAISDRGLELLSTTFIFSVIVTLLLYVAGCKSNDQSASLKPHITGNIIDDWWFGIQLNPNFLGVDLKFFFVRAGMMGWLLINLSVLAKSVQDSNLSQSMILYQIFCVIYIMDYFFYEEYMTSTWDIIAERLGFMLVFGDLVWIPFTFSIQGWWLMSNKVELTTAAVVANCCVFVIGYLVFRGANKQKHDFKKNPKALIWGQSPKVIGGKLLGNSKALQTTLISFIIGALSFQLTLEEDQFPYYLSYIISSILLIWRERRDEARCAEKYKEVWAEYRKTVPWRILPYVY
ncbi:delta(14)-sterol reductase [Tanacetum coccineum]